MRYERKQVELPDGMRKGSKVGVLGDGDEDYKIDKIVRKDGRVVDIVLSSGCSEPLCKIYLLRGSHAASFQNPANWVKVAIGECDICKKTFPDSCQYYRDVKDPENSMICMGCYESERLWLGVMERRGIESWTLTYTGPWERDWSYNEIRTTEIVPAQLVPPGFASSIDRLLRTDIKSQLRDVWPAASLTDSCSVTFQLDIPRRLLTVGMYIEEPRPRFESRQFPLTK